MATFYLTVNNEKKQPLNGVILTNGEYNTTPVSWPSNDTSGPGGVWEGTTNSNGVISSTVKYTCPGQWTGTLKASGYEDYPYSYTSGSVTGDFYDTVQMVQSSTSGGAPSNVGSNAGAGNVQNQATATGEGATLATTTAASNVGGDAASFISTVGLYAAIGLVAVAIIAVVVLLIL